MPALVAFAVLLAVVIAIVAAYRAEKRNQEKRLEIWKRFALEHDLRMVAPAGPWYRRSNWSLEGRVEGTPLCVETFVVSTGKSSITYTRIVATLEHDVPKVRATLRSLFTGWGEALGFETVATGDSGFDRRFAVKSKATEFARAVFDETVRARTAGFGPRRLQIECKGRGVRAWWRGAEKDPLVLESGCLLVAALGRACSRPRPARSS